MQKKKLEKVFCLFDDCLRIGFARLSLLRREYLSSSMSILHITKKDFFRLNVVSIDQQIY